MNKFILIIFTSTIGLFTSLSANSVGFTNLTTIAAELTCNHSDHEVAMIAYSGGYTVASNGVIVENKSFGDILTSNSAWLASFNPPKGPYTGGRISALKIPCTAAVAETQRYIYALAAIDVLALASNPTTAPIVPLLHFQPLVTSNEKGDVTYHWSIFAPVPAP